MTERYRLLARAQMDGAIREPGYIFALEEGELGPHRAHLASHHGASQLPDHISYVDVAEMKDVPLYEPIEDKAEAAEAAEAEREAKAEKS